MSRKRRPEATLARHWNDLVLHAPLVIAHRSARIATGAGTAAHRRRENARMVVEKPFAFAEAWFALASSWLATAPRLAFSFWQSLGTTNDLARAALPLQAAVFDAWRDGLAPLARRTRDNARRLYPPRRS